MKLLFLGLLVASSLFAKMVCVGGTLNLGNRIVVEFALYSDGEGLNMQQLCRHEEGAGYVRRILELGQDRAFGYELHVTRNPAGERPFHVFVTPAKSTPMGYFPRDPEPVDVGRDDTVEFVLLENKESRLRLVERFKVYDERDAQTVSHFDIDLAKEPRVPAGMQLQLWAPRVFRDSELLKLDSKGVGLQGSLIWIYVPGKGRFWFATTERGRFRATGSAKGNRLEFDWNGTRFAVECAKPVINLPGSWMVWVRLEEGWKPDPKDYFGEPIDPTFLYTGAVG